MHGRLVNPLSTEYEVAHYLEVSRPKVLAADTATWPTLFGAAKRPNLAALQTISLHGAQSPFDREVSAEKLFDQNASLPAFDLSQRDSREHTAVVCFSSGTSGKAKGVELSHYNLVATMLSIRATEPFYWSAGIRGVFFAPLCHIYGKFTVSHDITSTPMLTSPCRSSHRGPHGRLGGPLHHAPEEIHTAILSRTIRPNRRKRPPHPPHHRRPDLQTNLFRSLPPPHR
jgi:long-subunit acyl-CoA synthetase (AMP-forming)